MSDNKNPYLEMTDDVLKQHLEQIKVALDGNKIDVAQAFSIPTLSEDDKTKLEEHNSLTAKIKELSEAASARDLSDTEKELADASLNRVVRDIKAIDANAPISNILDSNFNSLQKTNILSNVENVIKHYHDQIETVKSELGTTDNKTRTYSEPTDTDDVESIFKEFTKKE